MNDKTAQQAHDLVEDTVTKAGEITEQARHALDDTVTSAKAIIRDFDDNAGSTVTAVRKFAADAVDKVTAAYKRNPTQVIALGTFAVAVLAALGTLVGKRR